MYTLSLETISSVVYLDIMQKNTYNSPGVTTQLHKTLFGIREESATADTASDLPKLNIIMLGDQ